MIYSIGIGPGDLQYLTEQAKAALQKAEVVVGYTFYIDLIKNLIQGKDKVDTGMKKERERAEKAFELAHEGKEVAVISSGDSGVYGMASLLWEMKKEKDIDIDIEVIPGVSAMFAAASALGSPLGHDFCSISLSDLLTPWEHIEKRIEAAAFADFVTAVYNPLSHGRFWQLHRLKDIFLKHRSVDTPVGIARNVGRKDEGISITSLKKLDVENIDMFTILIIGNSKSQKYNDKLITPRGYFNNEEKTGDGIGREIMNKSFQSILSQLGNHNYNHDHLWLALHCIHTTADFGMANLIHLSGNVVEKLHKALYSENPPVIITDVSMVTRGIRKSIVKKNNIKVKCYLDDERTVHLAEKHNITRTQAGIRLAVEEHPNALYVFGNAPTALIELVKHIRNKHAQPAGVIAAPVGFVNVKESKWQLQYGCSHTPSVIIKGNKGGSNIAATIINAIFSWNDAEKMYPGKGL